MKYIKYLMYVLLHKWYVMLECFEEGLICRGILHDLSKFLPSEFIPYANYFYGVGKDIKRGRDKTGYYKPTDTGDLKFDFAWLLHQKRNKHHWQFWVLPKDDGDNVLFEIREPYLTEMICDWVGAGKAQGYFSPKEDKFKETRQWWNANCAKMQLHPKTKLIIIKKIFENDNKNTTATK